MSSTPKSAPRNNSPDNETPDNSTPDDSTPDNADGSPESSKSPPSPPPPSESSPSPPPPSGNSPPPPSGNSPPPPSGNSPPPPSGSSKTPSPPPRTQGNSNSSVPSPPSSGRSSGSSSSRGQNSTASQTPSLASSSDSGRSSDSELGKRAIIGGVVGVGTFLIILVLVCFICRKKKRKQVYYYGDHALGKGSGYYNNAPPGWQGGPPVDHVMRVQNGMGHGGGWGGAPPAVNSAEMSSNYSGGPPLPPPSPNIMGLNQGTFTYDELAAATNGFTEANLIGQGGFGFVHKGVLPNGKEVAVKSLKANSGQGEREFQAEIEIISRVHHRHLVSLVGYCILGQQRMLVYEFVPNKTLEYHLHGKGQGVMDWPSRLRIALGSAKGLAYLHEDCHPRIIHRDIKAANVLIDDSFEAKVADFGLAKLTNDNNTHVSTRVMGTFGYLAPEYAQSGKLTEKSDVFSFGVMLLELITGRRPVDPTNVMEDSLVDWARPLLTRGLEEGKFNELADPFLEGNYNNEEMARMAASAAASIRHSGRKRPKMSQIVRALEGDVQLDDLNEGMKPGQSSIYGADSSYDTAQYQIDMKKIRMTALSSQEFNSSSSNDSREQTPNQRY